MKLLDIAAVCLVLMMFVAALATLAVTLHRISDPLIGDLSVDVPAIVAAISTVLVVVLNSWRAGTVWQPTPYTERRQFRGLCLLVIAAWFVALGFAASIAGQSTAADEQAQSFRHIQLAFIVVGCISSTLQPLPRLFVEHRKWLLFATRSLRERRHLSLPVSVRRPLDSAASSVHQSEKHQRQREDSNASKYSDESIESSANSHEEESKVLEKDPIDFLPPIAKLEPLSLAAQSGASPRPKYLHPQATTTAPPARAHIPRQINGPPPQRIRRTSSCASLTSHPTHAMHPRANSFVRSHTSAGPILRTRSSTITPKTSVSRMSSIYEVDDGAGLPPVPAIPDTESSRFSGVPLRWTVPAHPLRSQSSVSTFQTATTTVSELSTDTAVTSQPTLRHGNVRIRPCDPPRRQSAPLVEPSQRCESHVASLVRQTSMTPTEKGRDKEIRRVCEVLE